MCKGKYEKTFKNIVKMFVSEKVLRFGVTLMMILAVYLLLPGAAVRVEAAKTGFQTINGKTYYIKKNGQKQKGWLTLNGKKYYFNTSTGVQLKGWQYNSSKQKIRYFTKGQGYMVTGFLTDGSGNTRYFKPSDGTLVRGWMKEASTGYKYYFTSGSGVMAKGWLTDSKGQKRYFSKSSGRMLTGWQVLDSKTKSYRYFSKSTGVMILGRKKIGSYYYYFAKGTGIRYQKGFLTLGKNRFYFSTKNGRSQTGWLTLNGKKYYFDTKGVMYKDRTAAISGVNYKFDKNGVATKVSLSYTVVGNNVKVYDGKNKKYYYMMKEFVDHPGIVTETVTDRDLLAALCEAEAGDQGLVGMEAVALCVLNRTIIPTKEFPSSLRMVIYQGKSFAQYSVVTDGALLKKLKGQWYNRTQAYKAADAALKLFNNYVSKGTPRTLKGFDRKDFNFMYFMMESSFYKQSLNFKKVDNFLYKDHMFFVDWV